ncbi:hypothetical protein AB833_25565 [Chromatiales bacterium (ex Bugula neritina AB1)]|nr:hypothetical protein AB833_25565 [Chromatiales bacterium (ex Bugula neritina AB1)]
MMLSHIDLRKKRKILNARIFVLLICTTLVACDGGISGTGDGGPIVITPNGGNTNMTTDLASNEQAQTPYGLLNTLPSQVLTELPDPLISIPATSVTSSFAAPFNQQLQTLVIAGIQVQTELALIESVLEETLQQCAIQQRCSSIPATLQIPYTQDIASIEQQQLQRLLFTASRQSGQVITLNNLQFESSLAGYYDQRISYVRTDRSIVSIKWTSDRRIVSLLIDDARTVTQTLLSIDGTKNRISFRQADKDGATSQPQILSAVLESDFTRAEFPGVTIEANWHTGKQFYIRGLSNTNTAVFLQQPALDITENPQREIANRVGEIINIQTCTTGIDCTDWTTFFSTDALPDERINSLYTDFETGFGDSSITTTAAIDIRGVSTDVNTIVLSPGDSLSGGPEATDPVCSGQRVRGRFSNNFTGTLKIICWQPLPLQEEVSVYEESIQGSTILYRLITNTTIEVTPQPIH